MQLTDLFYYTIFVITLTASVAQGDDKSREIDKKPRKHVIAKRETVLLIDNFPYEPIRTHKPKVIYRRVSSQRYSPKPKYGPPRTKYRSAKPPRKPIKKYKKPVPQYGPPSSLKRPSKPRYGPPKKTRKPVYGPPKKKHYAFYSPEPSGFGEPPHDFHDFHSPKQSFAEPPIDSISSHPKPVYDPYQTAQDFMNPTIFDDEALKFGQEFKNWNIDHNDHLDTSYAYTQNHPSYINREPSFDPSSPDEDDDFNTFLDRYKFREKPDEEEPHFYERKRKPYYIDSVIAARPRVPQKPRTEDEEVLVGGQYAEPPARIIHKSYNNHSPYADDDDFSPALGYVDPDVAASATISPYVNYKNSNIAFSPQNLNDAFSIVDKK